ncbi:unnamed protein product [Fraxinus pennsylvanica]|uniref:Uncharacterized protein n=1 Tax=Fraxinus pennsylvanica TaxID=56036 RepID=A0AAD1ZPY4_9LAMI|nr:unnamed protein product [Fraxinus pennsylvanica]
MASTSIHAESPFQLNSLGTTSLGSLGLSCSESLKLQHRENQENATRLEILQGLDKSSKLFHMENGEPADSVPSAKFNQDQRFYQSRERKRIPPFVVPGLPPSQPKDPRCSLMRKKSSTSSRVSCRAGSSIAEGKRRGDSCWGLFQNTD